MVDENFYIIWKCKKKMKLQFTGDRPGSFAFDQSKNAGMNMAS